jgi:hypothetical protein
MVLSDRQIERYSRQIIVPGFGGRGQERLLAATLALSGELADLEAPLAYFVGAGVGTVLVEAAAGAPVESRMIDDLRALNPDSRAVAMDEPPARVDLLMMLIGSAAGLETARHAIARGAGGPAVLVRLDAPPRIALLAASPCPLCTEIELLGPFGDRAESAEFVAMLATAEAVRLLADQERAPAPRLIEFSGYESQSIALRKRSGPHRCRCESGRSGDG